MAHDILIVDDEADIRKQISGVLEDDGHTAREAADSKSAFAIIKSRRPSLILLDIWLEGSEFDGLEILRHVKREHPDVPVVMMSGHGTIETAVAAIKEGAYEFIEKPFNTDRLLLLIERSIEAARLKRENKELRLRSGGDAQVIGISNAMNSVRGAIDRVAPANSRVLVSGPAGTGKEVLARMLHAKSLRSDAPFIVLNCVSMQNDRVDIELFGTEGPIEGSDGTRKVGTFEQAHGGTLFFDEVADMPLETQGKIVRVLQEQSFERVGGTSRVEVDVRVIAATSHDLSKAISEGRFREDLYYRLSVVPINIPPLRERPEDIPNLANHFMTQMAEASGRQTREFGDDAMAALQAYIWPGNIRELRNIVERLLIMAPGTPDDPIRLEMLPGEITESAPTPINSGKSGEIMSLPLRAAREKFEREYLLSQVMRFNGNISRTASFVGMERSALHRKLKSLGLRDEDLRRHKSTDAEQAS
jgi:two-component system nitrogen regulation response regulator NtrX